jgi:hypothetical protein
MPPATITGRAWRTRTDPFAAVWAAEIEPFLRSDEDGELLATTSSTSPTSCQNSPAACACSICPPCCRLRGRRAASRQPSPPRLPRLPPDRARQHPAARSTGKTPPGGVRSGVWTPRSVWPPPGRRAVRGPASQRDQSGRLLGDHIGRPHRDQFGRLHRDQVAHPVTTRPAAERTPNERPRQRQRHQLTATRPRHHRRDRRGSHREREARRARQRQGRSLRSRRGRRAAPVLDLASVRRLELGIGSLGDPMIGQLNDNHQDHQRQLPGPPTTTTRTTDDNYRPVRSERPTPVDHPIGPARIVVASRQK